MSVKLKSIRPLSVLKYVAGSYLAFFLVLAVLFGCLGLFGFHTVTWNHKPVTGIAALPCACFISFGMWIGSTIFTWVALVVGFPVFRIMLPVKIEGEGAGDIS